MYNISPKMPSGQEHGVLRNCGLISSSPFVARRLFQLPSSAGFRQNSPWNLGCFSAVSRCCGFNPQVRGFLNRRLRLQEIPMSFSLKCWFQTYFFLLKLKYPIISCWNAHSRPWNLRLTSELRGFVVGIPGPGASCARRRVAFKRPCSRPGGDPQLIWSPVRRVETCKLNPAVQPILITFNWYPNRFLIQLQQYLLS